MEIWWLVVGKALSKKYRGVLKMEKAGFQILNLHVFSAKRACLLNSLLLSACFSDTGAAQNRPQGGGAEVL